MMDAAQEKIRLVIWDLDDTFWRGTLTEGGIDYSQSNHDTVVELAKRGIISSICSRNEHEAIETILRERGVWDYFVFPSIEWGSKGPRIKQIVESSQLRPPTILFIDDNHMNRAEAQRFVPGICVADPADMGSLLDNPLLVGKDDRDLKRLSQYKLLERRATDMSAADDSKAFLYESDIRVFIDHNVENHLDRAIELINRTNQLNFTKTRLSEDLDAAKQELLSLLGRMEIQAGIVQVVDRYGDYGYCGLYIQYQWLHIKRPKLIHFCFSCRTLGMEVETWLYNKLGRPDLDVAGEVLTDLSDRNKVVDWVRLAERRSDEVAAEQAAAMVPRVFLRGGCEMVAISHYFQVLTDRLVSEFAFQRDGLEVRLDHSVMLKHCLQKPDAEALQSLLALGYRATDFNSELLDTNGERCVYIFGLWAETNNTIFRHKELGHQVLVYLSQKIGGATQTADLLTLDPDGLNTEGWVAQAVRELQNHYLYEGSASSEATLQNLRIALRLLPQDALVFLVGCTEKTMDSRDFPAHIELNNVLRRSAAEAERTYFVGIDDHIAKPEDRMSPYHFSRDVYFRLYNEIREKINKWMISGVAINA